MWSSWFPEEDQGKSTIRVGSDVLSQLPAASLRQPAHKCNCECEDRTCEASSPTGLRISHVQVRWCETTSRRQSVRGTYCRRENPKSYSQALSASSQIGDPTLPSGYLFACWQKFDTCNLGYLIQDKGECSELMH